MKPNLPVGGAIRASLRGATKERSARLPVSAALDSVDIDGLVTPDVSVDAIMNVSGSGVVAELSKRKAVK